MKLHVTTTLDLDKDQFESLIQQAITAGFTADTRRELVKKFLISRMKETAYKWRDDDNDTH